MAHVSDFRNGAAKVGGFPFIARFNEVRKGLAESYAKYRSYRVTLGELQNLTQREIDDLGLQRGDFDRIAREAAMK